MVWLFVLASDETNWELSQIFYAEKMPMHMVGERDSYVLNEQ